MHNRNICRPIHFAVILSLGLGCPVLGATDTLPTTATTPTNTAPAPAASPAAAAETPSGPTTPTERPTSYTVVTGDTLWDLSHKFNCTVKQLKKVNNLKKNALKPGQVLKIPPAKSETPTPAPAKSTTSVKPTTSAKSIASAKPAKLKSVASQSEAVAEPTAYPRAQPVQDFDIPASTFASCPTPPDSSDQETAPVIAETPAPRTEPITPAESNPATVMAIAKPMPAAIPLTTKLSVREPAPVVATSSDSNDWADRFFQSARELGNQDIEYDESWRPPGESHSWDMDCSNTARYLYKVTTGIQLPRTASDQYYYLHLQNKAWDVPQASNGFADCNFLRHNLKPGDLLFWENTYKPDRQPPITHVMVFLGTNNKGQWVMAGSQTGRGGEHNRSHGGPDIYVFNPTRPCGGYTTWLGLVRHEGRFCAYGRPLEADRSKLAVAAND